MTIPRQTPDMDTSIKTPLLFFLIVYVHFVSGLDVPRPDKLYVNIWDGEVIVHWELPAGAPSNSKYNVQMGKYSGKWTEVTSCTGIKRTYCDLSGLLHDYRSKYKVRVQLVAGKDESPWTHNTFLPNLSKLQPPSFTLLATSSTLTVYVHRKPILKELFPFGLIYTIYLEERGQHKKNTTAYLTDDTGEDQTTMSFSSLRWGREYCVSITVEGIGASSTSSLSPKQCLLLPDQEWYIIAVASISFLCVLAVIAIMATVVLCYLRRPEKTPASLKSTVIGWLPLSVGEGNMEVVTDRGWFLSSFKTELKDCVSDPAAHDTVKEEDVEEDMRTSMDSGLGMEPNSATISGRNPPVRQEDSGCGSLGEQESSTSCPTDYPLKDQRTDADAVRKRDYGGVELCCKLDSSSVHLDGSPKAAGSDYRSHGPSAVQIHVCDDEELFKQRLPDAGLAQVVTGYRAGLQSCICSGAGQCTWCHKLGHHETELIKGYRAACMENGILSGKCDFVDPYRRGRTFSTYPKNTQMDTVVVEDFETAFIQMGEIFPLLTALSPLPLEDKGPDFNMNNLPLSLCDVQLMTD
uniref:Interleukin 10 receptor, alpha n=1 Tax=Gasterosteus aculeatus aculeatus TaxID=481459 RepID=A0AAQ4PI33_GASAC|nr:interleukin-10 receptor subunit alpha [Gasterosteus aculeatus aculeatus]